jgi:hypothetical protein
LAIAFITPVAPAGGVTGYRCGDDDSTRRDETIIHPKEYLMAKYGKAASKNVKSTMRRRKKGTLKSGSGRTVKSRKQAIAIALNEARDKGAKVPRKASRKKATRKTTKKTARKK